MKKIINILLCICLPIALVVPSEIPDTAPLWMHIAKYIKYTCIIIVFVGELVNISSMEEDL